MPLILDNEPNTQFQEIAHVFIASFPRPSFEPDYAAKAAAANGVRQPATTTTTNTSITSTTGTSTTSTTDKIDTDPSRLPKIEAEILSLVRQNQRITLQNLADNLNLTRAGVRYHTDNLKNKGLLRRVGTYNGHWEIVQK